MVYEKGQAARGEDDKNRLRAIAQVVAEYGDKITQSDGVTEEYVRQSLSNKYKEWKREQVEALAQQTASISPFFTLERAVAKVFSKRKRLEKARRIRTRVHKVEAINFPLVFAETGRPEKRIHKLEVDATMQVRELVREHLGTYFEDEQIPVEKVQHMALLLDGCRVRIDNDAHLSSVITARDVVEVVPSDKVLFEPVPPQFALHVAELNRQEWNVWEAGFEWYVPDELDAEPMELDDESAAADVS
jgi:hypothetical protein